MQVINSLGDCIWSLPRVLELWSEAFLALGIVEPYCIPGFELWAQLDLLQDEELALHLLKS